MPVHLTAAPFSVILTSERQVTCLSLGSSTVHYDVRDDAEGQGVDDEGTAASVGANEFPLGLDLVGADVALIGGNANLLIDANRINIETRTSREAPEWRILSKLTPSFHS